MPQQEAPHVPVLLEEVLAALAVGSGDVCIDGTYGAGGYSRALVAAGAQVIAFDQDPDVAEPDVQTIRLIRDRFSTMADHVSNADGVTLDIGVSSMQLDQAERGFSFQADGPLDMRMDQAGETAADFLNSADEGKIADIIFQYGDEPKSRRIARAIVAARPISTTIELARVVRRATGWRDGDKKDPATRTFQAIRIYINDELGELERGLDAAEQVLKEGGRLAVVTFHSLEDKIVKTFLRDRSGATPTGSRHLPEVRQTKAPSFGKLSKPIKPSAAEIALNPRARSATLRSAVRTNAVAWSQQSGGAL